MQVEHPVTEVQTGIDIVKEQLWIAFTGETALKQSDISPRGHSVRCRINAENPELDFQPSPGKVVYAINPLVLELGRWLQFFKDVKLPHTIMIA